MKDEDKKLEAIAEQWVSLVITQIEASKQQKIKSEQMRDLSARNG